MARKLSELGDVERKNQDYESKMVMASQEI